MKKILEIFCVSTAVIVVVVSGLDNGLALTPPMGWMSWQRYGCTVDCEKYPDHCLSEKLIMRTIDELVSKDYVKAGYEYVHIDDCWMESERNASGGLEADKTRFPRGIKFLADYAHIKGVKLGIYSDIGSATCQGLPGLADHFEFDASIFATWGVDAIKVDGCHMNTKDMKDAYIAFGNALNKTGRKILYSCSWPAYVDDHCENESDLLALKENCNLWRNFDDIDDSSKTLETIISFWKRSREDPMVRVAGPGHWNDPDMLLLGNNGLSYSLQKTQLGLWAILAAPLYISADVWAIPEETRLLLQNKNILSISQDKAGFQGFLVWEEKRLRIWAKPLHEGRYVICMQNSEYSFTPKYILFKPNMIGWPAEVSFSAIDAFTNHKDFFSHNKPLLKFVDEQSIELLILQQSDESKTCSDNTGTCSRFDTRKD